MLCRISFHITKPVEFDYDHLILKENYSWCLCPTRCSIILYCTRAFEVHKFCKKSVLGHPTLIGKALGFTHELSFFFFYQSTVLSSQAEDGHQMYFGGSVVGKASTIK